MNSCCCRSHSDRTDPMACLPQFPRLQRVQSCRPFLEGRKAVSCCVSGERRWGQRNGGMIQVLAKMVNKSSSTVCQFLHQLTLQVFARILYPLMMGWNTLKVPFVIPDICELYYGIFDECGNLRGSIPTRTLLILISMIQYFLNLPKRCGRNNMCPGCRSQSDDLRNIHNPGYCGKNAMTPFSGRPITQQGPSTRSQVWAGLKRVGYERRVDLDSYPSDESIPYGYAPHRCPCQAGDSKVQRSALGLTNPYANRSGPLRSLVTAEDLESPISPFDYNRRTSMAPISPKAAQLIHINHISNLYAAVVQNQHTRKLFADGKPPRPRVRPCTENQNRFSGGFMMPQPYFNGMPWSWLHRDPQRMIRLPSGGIPLQIPRYRRQPLDEEYHSFKSKYELMSRQDNPFKENSLLPLEYYPSENRFNPGNRLPSISWEEKIMDHPNYNISNDLRQIPVKQQGKMAWEELFIKRINDAKKTKGTFDYWREMLERNKWRTFQQTIKDIPIYPSKEYGYSQTGKESNHIIMKRSSNSLKTARQNQKKLEIEKPGISKRASINQRTPRIPPQHPVKKVFRSKGKQTLKNHREQVKPQGTNNIKSADKTLRLAKNAIINNPIKNQPNYPDPEDYRKEMARNRRNKRKTAGESVMLIKPAKSIIRKPIDTQLSAICQEDITSLKKQLEMSKNDKRVRFRVPKPYSFESEMPAEDSKRKTNRKSKVSGSCVLPEGGDQIPNQFSKLHSQDKSATKSVFFRRSGKSPERGLRKKRLHADDVTELPTHSKRATMGFQTKYHGNTKNKPPLSRSCKIQPKKILYSREGTKDVDTLNQRLKRR
ncbi:uncharacterized protein LOC6547498 [Drosophila erecta]|uniref:Uncharacterized protein n=1 Tax=Drosophila erecta TaxID=7220 RepID=B3NNI0_DROER|nr:uncharacterized protein LOC6547498 [Drosophila erecta]EDV56631.1 uncharacterized protein Dere_GG22755 [Drosophila erecta]